MRMYLDQYFNDDSQMYWIYINTWVQKVLCGTNTFIYFKKQSL